MIQWWPLLLPAAAWSGWWASLRQHKTKEQSQFNQLSHEYVVGLNYLLNEQPDKAVDIFIKLLDVDSDTVETHLALASLFRKRGEVDRAIRIHQNVIARPQLSMLQRREALLALAQDYMSAGLFDRAEQLFIELVATNLPSSQDTASRYGLLAIYQQEKLWEKALEVVQQLEVVVGTPMHAQAAHYYCELANQSLKNCDLDKARWTLEQSLLTDRDSVRASLMMAALEMKNNQYKQAIRYLKKVPEQDPEFLSEIIDPLVICHRELDMMDECVDYLEQIMQEHQRASLIFVIGEFLRREKGVEVAIDYVSTQISRYPSIRGLNRLIHWHLESANGRLRDKLVMLYNITSKFLENKPIYRCGHCGFGGKLLHWLCPSCKQWGKVKPIHGLEGD